MSNRARILDNERFHNAFLKCAHQVDHWLIGLYPIMPDHRHLVCAPGRGCG